MIAELLFQEQHTLVFFKSLWLATPGKQEEHHTERQRLEFKCLQPRAGIWWILDACREQYFGMVLEVSFHMFRNMAKTWRIARRMHEGAQMEGWVFRNGIPIIENASKQIIEKHMPKKDPTLQANGAQM